MKQIKLQFTAVSRYLLMALLCLSFAYQPAFAAGDNYSEELRQRAEQGDISAQSKLGYCYLMGNGIAKDYDEAVWWFRKAAEKGYSDGQMFLAYCYQEGLGVNQDYDKAITWYHKAIENGSTQSLYYIGNCYFLQKKYTEATKWWRKAAEHENKDGYYGIGYLYHFGLGVNKDINEALRWYRKALALGSDNAQVAIDNCLAELNSSNNSGGKSVDDMSIAELQTAAEQGNAAAQYRLGIIYGGNGNLEEAVKWFRKAAELGNADAQFNLGLCYAAGRGVSQSYVEALKWYRKAAAQGHKVAIETLEMIDN